MKRKCAVIGSPINHSKSPELHTFFYKQLGIEDQYEYQAVEVKKEEFEDFLSRSFTEFWVGFSVTMPLKEDIFKSLKKMEPAYLDIDDEFWWVIKNDPLVEKLGVANTLTFTISHTGLDEDGCEIGGYNTYCSLYNTDVYGIEQAIGESATYNEVKNLHKAIILGNGATSRSAKEALVNLGLSENEITIAGRHGDYDVDINNKDALKKSILQADIIVSTLPWEANELILPKFSEEINSKICLECAFPKILPNSIDGSRMLIWQAQKQVKLMTGKLPQVEGVDFSPVFGYQS
jgi:shikimate 5-dehydrogenase